MHLLFRTVITALIAINWTPLHALQVMQTSPSFDNKLKFRSNSSTFFRLSLAELEFKQVLRSRSADKCLKFIHIPKTAGTSIEETGWHMTSSSPIEWGAFDHSLNCTDTFTCDYGPPGGSPGNCCRLGSNVCSAWHVPPRADEKLAESYGGCDTFCVVRDPVERMVSEFQFYHPQDGKKTSTFRSWAESNLRLGQDPYRSQCFFAPQVEYVFSANRDVRYCNHILHFDNLEDEFNALMLSFDIPLTLMNRRYNNDTAFKMDIPSDIRGLITNVYKEDFEAFNFTYNTADLDAYETGRRMHTWALAVYIFAVGIALAYYCVNPFGKRSYV